MSNETAPDLFQNVLDMLAGGVFLSDKAQAVIEPDGENEVIALCYGEEE